MADDDHRVSIQDYFYKYYDDFPHQIIDFHNIQDVDLNYCIILKGMEFKKFSYGNSEIVRISDEGRGLSSFWIIHKSSAIIYGSRYSPEIVGRAIIGPKFDLFSIIWGPRFANEWINVSNNVSDDEYLIICPKNRYVYTKNNKYDFFISGGRLYCEHVAQRNVYAEKILEKEK
jgi:hypothetical protein